MVSRRALLLFAALAPLAPLAPLAARAQGRGPLVFAAASLQTALDEAAGVRAVISYAASSALARQIEAGAPADLFVSADLEWMDWLAERKLIRAETRVNLLGNRLVLIVPKDSVADLRIAPGFALAEALGSGRLAMGDTAGVPAGKYGKAALEALGVWAGVRDRVVQAQNVRIALALVARGEAPLGIVYATDAAAEPGVRVVDMFPEGTHPPIVYPAALTAASRHPEAASFLTHLRGARAPFERYGFTFLASLRAGPHA